MGRGGKAWLLLSLARARTSLGPSAAAVVVVVVDNNDDESGLIIEEEEEEEVGAAAEWCLWAIMKASIASDSIISRRRMASERVRSRSLRNLLEIDR